jgi:hypothetical protein
MPKFCAAGTAASPVVGPSSAHRKWKALSGKSTTRPTIAADGTLYTIAADSNGGALVALSPGGDVLWSLPVIPDDSAWIHGEGLDGVSSPTIGADGTLYTYRKGALIAVDPAGSVRWTAPIHALDYAQPPIPVEGGSIYWLVATATGGDFDELHGFFLHELAADGSALWKSDRLHTLGDAAPPPVLGRDGLLHVAASKPVSVSPAHVITTEAGLGFESQGGTAITASGALVFATDNGDGTDVGTIQEAAGSSTLWTENAGYDPGAPAVRPDGTIVLGLMSGISGDDTSWPALGAFSPTGTLLWRISRTTGTNSVTLDGAGTAYAAFDDKLIAFSTTGAVSWSLPGRFVDAPSIAADGTLYAPTFDGVVAIGP